MRITTLTSPVFGASCHLVVAHNGDAVAIDPGAGVADAVARAVREDGLRITGVLATHTHADHIWDASLIADAAGVPLTVHARDAYRLDDPLDALGEVSSAFYAALLAAGIRTGWRDPAEVALICADEDEPRTADRDLVFGSVRLIARHAPGHTEGSTVFLLDEAAVCTGDVLFRGSIGRTDLPGGNTAAMEQTLREVIAELPRDAAVLPGHGPAGLVSQERATNPFLVDLAR